MASYLKSKQSNNSKHIISPKDFDPSKIVFSDVMQTRNGGNITYVNYDFGKGKPSKFYIEIPPCVAPFGISQYPPKDKQKPGEKVSYSLNQSREIDLEESIYTQDDIDEWFNKMEIVDQRAIDYAMENSQKLLGIIADEDEDDPIKVLRKEVRSKYSPIVRKGTNDKGNPVINKKTGKPMVDKNGNPYPDKILLKFYPKSTMMKSNKKQLDSR